MKGENISMRLRRFASNIVKLCREMPGDAASRHIMRQLVRAGTGGGSNYEEARGAESRADFIHKVAVATKEVRESLYWLRLAQDSELVAVPLDALVKEANELVAILSSSLRTARQRGESTSPAETRSLRTRDGEGPGSLYLCAPSE